VVEDPTKKGGMNDKNNKQDQTTIYGETKTSRAIVKCSHPPCGRNGHWGTLKLDLNKLPNLQL
jgi:hypothetical protein